MISTFEDRAISGTGAINRPGFQALMRAAEARLFDVIVAEDLDRVFRDQADYHTARKHLDHLGVSLHTVSGKVGKLDGALRALMSEMFIENLVIHTRRGLEGVIRDGRHAGAEPMAIARCGASRASWRSSEPRQRSCARFSPITSRARRRA